MIVIEKPNNVRVSGIQDSVSFGIKEGGLSHIFGVLRKQLYSDPILACLREYACNGVDSHTEKGTPNRPIEITLPSRFSSTLKIRDFGQGMSEDQIHEIYAYYGESSKRSSNQLIGQLGLGSKSGFAYGDNFIITSYNGGYKTVYNAYIDPSQIGKIAKMGDSQPSTEESGLEISIPVKQGDHSLFHDKAQKLFQYFTPRPIVHGATFTYPDRTPVMKGKDWAIYGNNSSSVAVMGCIGYTIDNHWPGDNSISSVLSSGLEVSFNIGELSISASREKLQYDDRTKKTIHDKLISIIAEVTAELNKRFSSCQTMFDARKLYGTVMDFSSNLYQLRNLVSSVLTFKGIRVSSSDIQWSDPTDGSFGIRKYESSYRSTNKINSNSYRHITCRDKTMLIDNDLNITSGITNRVYNAVTAGKEVFVLSYRTPADKQKFFGDSKLEQSNFVLLSSLPKIVLSTASGAVKNTKHASKEFSYDFGYASKCNGWHRRGSDFWKHEVVDVTADSGVYLIINAFDYRSKSGNWDNPNELNAIIKSLAVFGINLPTIYGFKLAKEVEVKKNPNMVLLWDYISAEITKYFKANNIEQMVADRLEYDNNCRYSWFNFMVNQGKVVKQTTEFAKAAAVFEQMNHSAKKKILDEAVKYREYFSAVAKPAHDLAKLVGEVEEKYPLFNAIKFEYGTSNKKAIIQYIDLMG